jgi:hypothetical protein
VVVARAVTLDHDVFAAAEELADDPGGEARGLLRWSQRDLAVAADVPLWFVIAFEDGDSPAFLAAHEVDLREALEAAGIRFDGDVVTFAAEGHGGIN